jgi:hypothetical protein
LLAKETEEVTNYFRSSAGVFEYIQMQKCCITMAQIIFDSSLNTSNALDVFNEELLYLSVNF